MNLVDLAVLAILALSALAGLSRGLVREVLGLAAWAGAGYVAIVYAPGLIPTAQGYITDPGFASAASYIVSFVAALAVFSVAASVLGRMARVPGLGGLDGSLGLVFGLARGAVVLAGLYVLAGLVWAPQAWPAKVQQARSLPFVYDAAAWMVDRLPPADRPRLAAPPAGPPITAAELSHPLASGRANGPAPARD